MATNHKSTSRVDVNRTALSRITFDELAEKIHAAPVSYFEQVSNAMQDNFKCSGHCLLQKIRGLLPCIDMLRTYKFKKYLLRDMIAGFSVGMIHIPQGMGFAMLSNVSPVYGLYSSFFPVILYFFFGSSRHMSVGTMAIISLIVGSVVQTEADEFLRERRGSINITTINGSYLVLDSSNSSSILSAELDKELQVYKASIASALSLIASAIMLLMGILRLGSIKCLMPTSFIGGFTTGGAFHITTSQLKTLFKIQGQSYEGVLKLPYTWIEICRQIPNSHIPTLILAFSSIAILTFFKEFVNEKLKKKLPVPIPIEMIVLIAGTALSYFLDFRGRWDIQTVGPIPRGIPAPFIPPVEKASGFMIDAVIAAILCFTISIAMADIFSRKHKYQVDSNQELIAYGLSYGLSSFFYSFLGASAPPRCFVLDSTGGKTQMSNVFIASLLLLVLLAIGPLFVSLPNSILACIIIVALLPLFKQFQVLPSLWRLSRADFSIWMVTFVSSIILTLDLSLAVGIGWAVLTVALAGIGGRGYTLGQTKHQDLFAPTKTHAMALRPQGIVIFRYESSLFFATIKKFKNQLYNATVDPETVAEKPKEKAAQDEMDEFGLGSNKREKDGTNVVVTAEITASEGQTNISQIAIHEEAPVDNVLQAVILDCSPFAYVDLMGLNALRQINSDFQSINVRFMLANCTNTLLRKLDIDGQLGGENGDTICIYPTIQDAVAAATAAMKTDSERIVTCL